MTAITEHIAAEAVRDADRAADEAVAVRDAMRALGAKWLTDENGNLGSVCNVTPAAMDAADRAVEFAERRCRRARDMLAANSRGRP